MSDPPPEVAAYLLGATGNRERLARAMLAAARHLVRPRLLGRHSLGEGRAAASDRQMLRDHFEGETAVRPAEIAAVLTHAAAWLRVAAGTAPAALVLEEAGHLVADPARVASAAEPFDVLFVNDRMARWAGPSRRSSLPLDTVIAARARQPSWRAPLRPGAEGYLLSRRGARRLLGQLERHGAVAPVDWLMVWHGLAERGRRGRHRAIRPLFRLDGLLERTEPGLEVHVLTRPLVRHMPGADPVRSESAARVPLARLRAPALP